MNQNDKRPGMSRGRIQPKVLESLSDNPDGRVYVTIELNVPLESDASEDRVRIQTAKAFDDLLSMLAPNEFELHYRFDTPALVVGHVSAAGINKLRKLAALKRVAVSKIESPVISELRENPDSRPLVMVRLIDVRIGHDTLSEKTSAVSEIQQRVLNKLSPNEYELMWQFSYIELFSARVSAPCLATLATDPDVKVIYGNEVFQQERMPPPVMIPNTVPRTQHDPGQRSPLLDDSIPLVQALAEKLVTGTCLS